MAEDWQALNRAWWDERVPLHVNGRFYDVAGFKAGRSSLAADEIRDLAPVAGKRLLHLQCHFGLDTLSWARLGAEVTGLDFSPKAIAAARALAAELGLAATFLAADVYDAPAALRATYDIVYTGIGALMWLPDITRWAEMVAQLLRPGGELYLVEFHPFEWILGEHEPVITFVYFTPASGLRLSLPGSYADLDAATEANTTLQWNHPLGEVVTALIRAGLTIRELRESDQSYIRRWPMMEETDGGLYRLPAHMPSLPLMYTLRAVR